MSLVVKKKEAGAARGEGFNGRAGLMPQKQGGGRSHPQPWKRSCHHSKNQL